MKGKGIKQGGGDANEELNEEGNQMMRKESKLRAREANDEEEKQMKRK